MGSGLLVYILFGVVGLAGAWIARGIFKKKAYTSRDFAMGAVVGIIAGLTWMRVTDFNSSPILFVWVIAAVVVFLKLFYVIIDK